MPDPQPQGRQPYKRFAPQVWNQHKNTIRELFLEQDKTHEDVAAILKERHGFAIGARQLKRKTDEWGFFKNIPGREMGKMLRTQQRRQEQLGRPTKFLRKQGAGEFQEVPAMKLDAYQKRFGVRPISSMSQSSGLPSNVMYDTPSNYTQTPRGFGPAASAARSSDEMALEFNNSTEQVFSDTNNNALGPPLSSRQNRGGSIQVASFYQLAKDNAFESDYQTAAQKFKLLAQVFARRKSWKAVLYQFNADVMEAACYSGCPLSLVARVANILSHSLIREREKYSNSNSEIGNEAELCKVLSGLKLGARFWGSVIAQQRALQIWEPILGQGHAKIVLLWDNLAEKRCQKPVNLNSEVHLIEPADTLDVPLEIDRLPSLKRVGDLLHLGDAPADQLLEKLQAIESSSISGPEIRREMAVLRYGRSRALLGVYYSFINRFGDAEKAFQDSERHMEYETCVEIKLHRMLWYAEHKTRVPDWDGVGRLICHAHEVFMANDTPSEFIIGHFPGRFKTICSAISAQIPIDKITNETEDVSSPEYLQTGTHHPVSPFLSAPAIPQSSPAAANSALPPQRLFPSTPRGVNSEIDIDAWRRFVHFSPTAEATPTQVTPAQVSYID